MTARRKTQLKFGMLVTVTVFLLFFSGCSESGQEQLEELAGELAQTAVAEGEEQLKTAAVEVGQTVVAEGQDFVETQAVILKATAEAELATQIARTIAEIENLTPSPWDTSWIPSDKEFAANRIDAILEGTGLADQGGAILQDSLKYGVNPAFALAIFRKEASFAAEGTRAKNNNNPGNISATGDCRGLPAGSSCDGHYGETGTDGRFGVYDTMADGVNAYFQLMKNEYMPGTSRNCSDMRCINSAYCPAPECNVDTYEAQMILWTKQYQREILSP